MQEESERGKVREVIKGHSQGRVKYYDVNYEVVDKQSDVHRVEEY